MATTILLGPQRFATTVTPALRSLEVEGPVAVVNAGWEERESDDAELDGLLDGRARNLRLHHRMMDVIEADERFRAAAIDFRDRHDELRAFYGIRLQAGMDAVHAVARRTSRHGTRAAALDDAVASLRAVDAWYSARLKDLYRDLDAAAPAEQSGPLVWHRGEIREALADCAAVVLPGGHVGSLLRALRMFAIDIPDDVPVVAWSAGAMALTDRVVLFHDFTPHGVSAPELYDRGLARLRGVVALPHARRRLRLDDEVDLSALAGRFPDHALVLLDDGTRLRLEAGPGEEPRLPAGARVVGADGRIGVSA
jgi:hypothetical protein